MYLRTCKTARLLVIMDPFEELAKWPVWSTKRARAQCSGESILGRGLSLNVCTHFSGMLAPEVALAAIGQHCNFLALCFKGV